MTSFTFDNPLSYLLIGAVVLFVIYRQFATQPLNGRRLLVIPALLGFFALRTLPASVSIDAAGAALLAFNLLIGAAAGVLRGLSIRIWTAGGTVWTRGTALTLGLWAGLIVYRIAVVVASHAFDLPALESTSQILGLVAVTFAAQNAMVWLRAQRFAPVEARS